MGGHKRGDFAGCSAVADVPMASRSEALLGGILVSHSRRHVAYESRLELAWLLLADFDTSVSQFVAQPFPLVTSVDGKQRKHIPDYLLIRNDGPVVVDVKPRQHLTKPAVVGAFAWTRKAVESRRWRYEVWSEAPLFLFGNVRFLAGYRRTRLFESSIIDRMSSYDLLGTTVGEAIRNERSWPEMMVRAALMHLLWRQHFTLTWLWAVSGANATMTSVAGRQVQATVNEPEHGQHTEQVMLEAGIDREKMEQYKQDGAML
jgi:TnsA-like endonuclease N terminal